jgi:hypothetical protein
MKYNTNLSAVHSKSKVQCWCKFEFHTVIDQQQLEDVFEV